MAQIHEVILDMDGTLKDSNDAHSQAWVDAMAENGYDVPFEKVRRLIGMGGDNLLPEVIDQDKDSPDGKKISERWEEILKEKHLPHLKAFPKAKELLQRMHQRGLKLALASSAKEDQLKALLKIVGAEDLIETQTSSSDVKHSKPEPDIVAVALQKIGFDPDEVVMLGDTPFDVEATPKVGVNTIGLRSGGFTSQDLAGAIAIYDDPADLLTHYNSSPLSEAEA